MIEILFSQHFQDLYINPPPISSCLPQVPAAVTSFTAAAKSLSAVSSATPSVKEISAKLRSSAMIASSVLSTRPSRSTAWKNTWCSSWRKCCNSRFSRRPVGQKDRTQRKGTKELVATTRTSDRPWIYLACSWSPWICCHSFSLWRFDEIRSVTSCWT